MQETGLELLVMGVQGALSQNLVKTFLYDTNGKLRGPALEQRKHHRWRVDGRQVRRYSLGSVLDPSLVWWEMTPLGREVRFWLFRWPASMAALVCEDLARIDPVQQVVRAVGPNLVVALLMDGPQLEWRWPAQYATVLADDPGCSVLTLTSRGMMERWRDPAARPAIALWKQPDDRAQELTLGPDADALVLMLSLSWSSEVTLDRRYDEEATVRVSMAGIREIRAGKPTD